VLAGASFIIASTVLIVLAVKKYRSEDLLEKTK
jgi:hypothetical protein